MIRHGYLITTLTSVKISVFVSDVTKGVTGVSGFTLKHASENHAQTIGLFERSDTSIKQALKIETGKQRSFWQVAWVRQ